MKKFKRTYPRTDRRHKDVLKRFITRGIDYDSNYLSWQSGDITIIAYSKTNNDVRFLKHLNFIEE